MDAATIKAAQEALAPLFKKLGELGSAGWELALRQNMVYVIEDAIVLLTVIVFGIFVCVACHRCGKRQEDGFDWVDESGNVVEYQYNNNLKKVTRYHRGFWSAVNEDTDTAFGAGICTIIFSIIFCIVFYGESFSIINRVMNPSFMALKDIIHLLN